MILLFLASVAIAFSEMADHRPLQTASAVITRTSTIAYTSTVTMAVETVTARVDVIATLLYYTTVTTSTGYTPYTTLTLPGDNRVIMNSAYTTVTLSTYRSRAVTTTLTTRVAGLATVTTTIVSQYLTEYFVSEFSVGEWGFYLVFSIVAVLCIGVPIVFVRMRRKPAT